MCHNVGEMLHYVLITTHKRKTRFYSMFVHYFVYLETAENIGKLLNDVYFEILSETPKK